MPIWRCRRPSTKGAYVPMCLYGVVKVPMSIDILWSNFDISKVPMSLCVYMEMYNHESNLPMCLCVYMVLYQCRDVHYYEAKLPMCLYEWYPSLCQWWLKCRLQTCLCAYVPIWCWRWYLSLCQCGDVDYCKPSNVHMWRFGVLETILDLFLDWT